MSTFLDAARDGNLEELKQCIAKRGKGIINVEKDGRRGKPALMLAAFSGHLPIVKELISCGANVDELDDDGWTSLMSAARNNQIEVVRYLLAHGAKVNEKDGHGWSALMHSTVYGLVDICKELIAHGASVHDVNKFGYSMLHSACNAKQNVPDSNIFEVFKILLANGTDPYATNQYNETALEFTKRDSLRAGLTKAIQDLQAGRLSVSNYKNKIK